MSPRITPLQAIKAAKGGYVEEGSTGGGNGMIAYEFKGGTGTSSRKVSLAGQDYTVGALVQANHGRRAWLTVLGKPVGKTMPEGAFREKEVGLDHRLYRHGCAPVAAVAAAPCQAGLDRDWAGGHAVGQFVGRYLPGLFSVANPGPMPHHSLALGLRGRVEQRDLGPDLPRLGRGGGGGGGQCDRGRG